MNESYKWHIVQQYFVELLKQTGLGNSANITEEWFVEKAKTLVGVSEIDAKTLARAVMYNGPCPLYIKSTSAISKG